MNGFDISTAQGIYIGSQAISGLYLGSTQIWPAQPAPTHDYSQDYLTIVSLVDNNTIGWRTTYASLLRTISISTDAGSTWSTFESSTSGTTLATLNTGDKLLIKGSNATYGSSAYYYNFFTSTGNFNIEGNIMSLIYGDNFIGQTALSVVGTFMYLFSNSNVVSAENFILPATHLTQDCYNGMFSGCTSLTTAPELPATTLISYCYNRMFSGCTSLTTAPELPATTVSSYCYANMFYGCTSLTTASETLPATTLVDHCYYSMFYGCTSLTTAPELPATTLTNYCYYNMFRGCTSLNYIKCLATNISATHCTTDWVDGVAASGTFERDANMLDWTTGTSGIPSGWTVDPPIPVPHDYSQDYFTIESLSDNNVIKMKCSRYADRQYIYISTDNGSTWTFTQSTTAGEVLATLNTGDKLLIKTTAYQLATGTNYYNNFITTGTFKVYGNIMSLLYGDNFIGKTSFTTSNYDYQFVGLFYGCTNLVSAEHLILPATTLKLYCYYSMFNGCTSLTTAPKLPATTLTNWCYAYMFYGCTSLTTAPELPATTLTASCYNGMFNRCSSLNYIKCLATDISAASCTSNWVLLVSQNGTFVKDPNMSSWTTGTSGIPSGWTVQNA